MKVHIIILSFISYTDGMNIWLLPKVDYLDCFGSFELANVIIRIIFLLGKLTVFVDVHISDGGYGAKWIQFSNVH